GRPFPNNTIDPSRFSPQALALLKYVPQSGDACGKHLFGVPDNQNEDQVIGRVDWIRSERHSIFGRYFIADFRNPAVFDGKNILLTTNPGARYRVQTLALGDTYSFDANTINSFHFTWSRKRIARGPAANIIEAKDIGLNIAPSPGNFPSINVNGRFSTSCGTCSSAIIGNNSLQFADDMNLVRGRHQVSFGLDSIHNGQIFEIQTETAATYTFDGTQTGDSLADFLLGLPSLFHQGNVQNLRLKQNYLGLYAEDQFRVSSRLAVSAGLRWEPYFPAHDKFGQASVFDHAAFLARTRSARFLNAPAGMFYPGDPGVPPGGVRNHLGNLAPRLGFVWDPAGNGRMTIRTSYGILYDFPHLQNWNRFGVNPPFASSINIYAPAGGFGNPYLGFPGGNPFPGKFPPGPDAAFPPGGAFTILPLDLQPAYMQQWNLTIQRQVAADWLLSASYLGNASRHRLISRYLNPAKYIPGNCAGKPCSTVANTNDRRILSLENPVDVALISTLSDGDNGANASYNALLLSANRRLRRNFSVLVNYTWSHCISEGDAKGAVGGSDYQNPLDRKADRGNCVADIRHIFNASLVAMTPDFSARTAQRLFGNWQLSAILTKRSGFWFSVASGKDNSLTAMGNDRPDIVGDPHAVKPSLARWFNTAAFRANAAGTYGNSGANNLVGPGAFNFDVSLVRNFVIREKHTFQVRAEAFNILNHPNFANPIASMTNSNIGQILAAAD
ncbi:MAG: TonB-dependent receptor, partial [Candidatus Sumerlaeota bacterium]|nr:TonB-dependent receptor [Candidatus Sumerlaeota bacterium]